MSSSPALASSSIRPWRHLRAWLAGCVGALVLAACGGGGGGDLLDRGIGAVLNFEGQFEALDGLAVELNGDTATVLGFGDSPLGSNPSLLAVGQPFARNVQRTGDASFSAEVAVPQYSGGVLSGLTYTPVSVSLEGGVPAISGAPAGYPYAGGWQPYEPPGAMPPDAFGTDCQAYWQPILAQGSARWRVTRAVGAFGAYDGVHPDKRNWTWSFSNFRSGRVHVAQRYDSLILDRTVTPHPHPDAPFAPFPLEGEPHCRINGDAAGTLFFKRYDATSGELVVYESQTMDLLTWVLD